MEEKTEYRYYIQTDRVFLHTFDIHVETIENSPVF